MNDTFQLHGQLAKDTVEVARWGLSRVLLTNDSTYPWLILVPERVGLRDFHHLAPADLPVMTHEILRASKALESAFKPDKMNVAALGNQVPQLHVHVIARFTGDPAWPGPVWGVQPAVPYGEAALAERLALLRRSFEAVAP
jgi:diadenosine tetraphosphate (Ap4A) HIT family hydrolase